MDKPGATHPARSGTSMLIAAVLAVALTAVIVVLGQTAALGPGNATQVVALALMWLLAGAVVLWWMRLSRAAELGFRPPSGRDMAWGVGAGIVLMLLVALLGVLSTALSPDAEGVVAVHPTSSLPLLVFGVSTAAVCEEVIFRGAVMSALQERGVPTWGQVLVQAAAFSLIHLAWPLPHVLLVVLPLSLALGALFALRRNLVTVMLAHLLIDLPLVAVLLISGAS